MSNLRLEIKNTLLMSTAQIREALIKQLGEADDRLLKMMYAMVEAYLEGEADQVVGYDSDGKAQYVNDLKKELGEEVKRAKEGKYISLEELHKQSDQWLKPSK